MGAGSGRFGPPGTPTDFGLSCGYSPDAVDLSARFEMGVSGKTRLRPALKAASEHCHAGCLTSTRRGCLPCDWVVGAGLMSGGDCHPAGCSPEVYNLLLRVGVTQSGVLRDAANWGAGGSENARFTLAKLRGSCCGWGRVNFYVHLVRLCAKWCALEVQVSVREGLRFKLKVAAVRKPCGVPDFPSGSGALRAQFS